MSAAPHPTLERKAFLEHAARTYAALEARADALREPAPAAAVPAWPGLLVASLVLFTVGGAVVWLGLGAPG